MKKIYMDNGSTSFPKAPGVGNAMKEFLDSGGFNIGRGGYESSYRLAKQVFEAREKLCTFFHFNKESNVIFTSGVTGSLNMIIAGLFRKGDHVISTSMEHNAAARPLEKAKERGVLVSYAACNEYGELNPQDIAKAVSSKTKAVLMLHASNVCGTLMPLAEIGRICKEHDIFFIVDSAQTAGAFPIYMDDMKIDCLAFTGHKGLLGPQGIGGFLIGDKLASAVDATISGGTGSISDVLEMPVFLPDKFEPGTLNIPGILGLSQALDYVNEIGIDAIREKELSLTGLFLDAVNERKGIRVIGRKDIRDRCAIVSLDFPGKDNADISFLLDEQYGIMTRSGLHCAPLAHRTLGTFPHGTVRFAFSHFNEKEEILYAVEAIDSILSFL